MRFPATLLKRTSTLRPAVLSGIVLLVTVILSLVVGALAGNGRNNIALLVGGAPILVFTAMFLSNKFETAVLLLPIMALSVPIDFPTGTYSKLPISLVLSLTLCGLWVISMVIRNQFKLASSPLNLPMLVFCATSTLSLIWGFAWRDPILDMNQFKNFQLVQIASLLTYIVSVGAALLVGNFAQTPKRLKFIFGTFLFFGSLMTIAQLLRVEHRLFTDRGLWGLWTVAPAFCLLIQQPNLPWRWRALLLLLIAGNLYQTMIVNLLWKSGWIPTIVAIVVAIFLRSRRWFLVMMLVGSVVVFVQRDFFNQMIEAELEEGADERVGMWEINLRVVSEHWLLGTGPAGYAPYYMTYYPNDARSTHNNYLDIIAQFGVVGTIVWLWLAITATIEAVRLYLRAPPGFLKTLSLTVISGWVAAQVSMFFGDWILPFAYNQTITGYKYTVFSWIFLGMVISIRHLLQKQAEPAVQAELQPS